MNISALQGFYRGFYITEPEGNNIFSYDRRSCKKIHVPPLVSGSLDDVKAGDETVFSDIVEGKEVDAYGLRQFVHIEHPGQDIFIFDNHNHAFSFWGAAIAAGVLPRGLPLVHVDQHKDTREPLEWFAGQGTFEACHYANHVLNVGNFIPPALKAGWFKDVVQIGSAEAFAVDLNPPFILDIDLDVFAPIMSHIPEDVKISRLRAWIARARFITIATSPFFIDQNQALHYVRRLI